MAITFANPIEHRIEFWGTNSSSITNACRNCISNTFNFGSATLAVPIADSIGNAFSSINPIDNNWRDC